MFGRWVMMLSKHVLSSPCEFDATPVAY
jgi:hypothetical protein